MRASDDVLRHLCRARDHADRHYDQPLDLEQLAAVAGISKYHFQRLFTATYGMSRPSICRADGWNARRTCCVPPI